MSIVGAITSKLNELVNIVVYVLMSHSLCLPFLSRLSTTDLRPRRRTDKKVGIMTMAVTAI